ncbi:TPA: hypothetical protein R5X29_000752 [Enterobacter sichuanensis]|nr:hypothetical protein [Enterobacter sichuanensis]
MVNNQAYRADGGDIGTDRIKEIANNPYGDEEKSWLAQRVLASLTVEHIYQCEFCHHDENGELQWHWEDVNKDFYDQYDSERRGRRRIIFTAPPAPVVPELCAAIEALLDMQVRMVKQTNVGASFFDGETISAMNYAPIQAKQALELAKPYK